MHQLEKQQFQQLSRWRRFVQTGEVSHIRHLRDLFGFMEYNTHVLSYGNRVHELMLPPKIELTEQLSPGIYRVAAELLIPGIVATLETAEPSLHEYGMQVACRLRIDRGAAGVETTAAWRSLYFGKEAAPLLADPALTYDHWMQNAIFRCMTKSYQAQDGRAHGEQRVRESLKPEHHVAYARFLTKYGSGGLPWGL